MNSPHHSHPHKHGDHDHRHEQGSHHEAHGHGHSHGERANERLLTGALVITLVFMVIESISGWIANSLALIADAGHMFTDAAALALALVAVRFATRAPDSKRSFGYQRLQVLATFVNGIALLAIVGWIALEAIQKFIEPRPVNSMLMLTVASLGAVVNVIVFFMLRHGDHDDMNIAAATLHVIGDLLGSVGAIIGAIVILYTGWTPIDPLISVVLCLLIVRSAWALVRKSTHILLEGAPDWLDPSKLRATLQAHVPAIKDVHHVHCWSLSPKETLLTLHATVTDDEDHNRILQEAQRVLADHYGITHATIQLEYGQCVDGDCA
jgi:cobalt-zinc-cadmium efflux system protein